jgi:predicted nucleotidyltransferase
MLSAMFTGFERSALRDWLILLARADTEVTAAAVLGSGADGHEDQWSDIDLALRLAPGQDPAAVANRWSKRLGERVQPITHMDLWSSGALYRVFLLPGTLQLDLSFWPNDRFAAYGPHFRLVFGEANEAVTPTAPSSSSVLGWAWLFALHARSSIARRRVWQAVYMINGIRDRVVELACVRHDLPQAQGRGVDDLPLDLKSQLKRTLPRNVEVVELQRAFGAILELLVTEARHVDPEGAQQLGEVLAELAMTSVPALPDDKANL